MKPPFQISESVRKQDMAVLVATAFLVGMACLREPLMKKAKRNELKPFTEKAIMALGHRRAQITSVFEAHLDSKRLEKFLSASEETQKNLLCAEECALLNAVAIEEDIKLQEIMQESFPDHVIDFSLGLTLGRLSAKYNVQETPMFVLIDLVNTYLRNTYSKINEGDTHG
jgi:hypothetical protein